MSKLEEIKERLNDLLPSTHYKIKDPREESFKWASAYQSDVQYLLSRLEIAEKALEKVHHRSSTYHEFESTHEVLSDIRKRSIEALQQIRGG